MCVIVVVDASTSDPCRVSDEIAANQLWLSVNPSDGQTATSVPRVPGEATARHQWTGRHWTPDPVIEYTAAPVIRRIFVEDTIDQGWITVIVQPSAFADGPVSMESDIPENGCSVVPHAPASITINRGQ
jgi:hypothetical protein